MPRSALVSNNRILGDLGHNRIASETDLAPATRRCQRLRPAPGPLAGAFDRHGRQHTSGQDRPHHPPAEAGPCSGKYLLGRRQLSMKPALGIGLHGINVDLRLVDEAAFRASQGPMLKAGTRRDSALDCHKRLASGTARKLGGARRQFGRRRLQIGHGIGPYDVLLRDVRNVYHYLFGAVHMIWPRSRMSNRPITSCLGCKLISKMQFSG